MDQQPKSIVPVQAPQAHKMWNVLSILFLVLFILSALFNVFLFMSWSSASEEVVESDMEDVIDESVGEIEVSNILDSDLRGAYSYTASVTGGTLYTSSIYSFSVTLPSTWGALYEEMLEEPSSSFKQVIRISSLEDTSRYIDIYVVNSSSASDPLVVDLPAVKVGEISGRYVYLISASGDTYGRPGIESPEDKAHFDEGEEIRASFEPAI